MFETSSSPAPLNWLKSQFTWRRTTDLFAERRSVQREKISFNAEIEGPEGPVRVKGVDIHGQGAMVLSKQSLAAGTVLFLRLKDFQLGGVAEVRHSTLRKDGRYAIGLKFRGPLAKQAGKWGIQRVYIKSDAWTSTDDCKSPSHDLFKVA